jgi:integrase/recombinase XerD
MKIKDEIFFKTIRDFLTIYLPRQRCYSQNTVKSYKIALNLFIDYLTKEKKIPLSQLTFSCIEKETVICFLDWLQTERQYSSSTRNQRLMALRSFAKYAGLLDVSKLSVQIELAKIPVQKSARTVVEFLSEEALKVLLNQPDIQKNIGLRDRFFMILMYDTAARCQEMLNLKLKDFELNTKNPFIYLRGKGGKTRTVPLMSKTIQHYNTYIDIFHPASTRVNTDFLFYTRIHNRKNQMTPDNVEKFMKKYGEQARLECSDIPDRVHPHQLRHTRSIHLYRGGMPLALLSEFLGHVQIETTRVYAYADTEMKRNAIQKACTNSNENFDEEPIWCDDEETIRKLYGLS